jgi:hypothetical protein
LIVKGRLLALTLGLLLIGAAPAAADSSFGGQSAAQQAGNMQSATSGATSTQYNPSNQNISVRVLSPGSNGPVTQSNNSNAQSGAANLNATGQGISQSQSDPASEALRQAEQWAANHQSANSNATSTQKHPSNQNISVRVLSPGSNGPVNQSNNSNAQSFAGNLNLTSQHTHQSQGGSGGTPVRKAPSQGSSGQGASNGYDPGKGSYDPCGCNSGSEAIQAAGQEAGNKQTATSNANSTQIDPSNENISVRVLSPGYDGPVEQQNNSNAESFAGNANLTKQSIKQFQPGTGGCGCEPVLKKDPCGCSSGGNVGIQAAAQQAWNEQNATSNATSMQWKPQNVNKSLRLGEGHEKSPHPSYDPSGSSGSMYGSNGETAKPAPAPGGAVSQENNSNAQSKALNLNGLWQGLFQSQESGGEDLIS